MTLNLQNRGLNLGAGDNAFNLLAVEVGQANMLAEALLHQGFHGLPRIFQRVVRVPHGSVRVFWKRIIARLKAVRPVNQIQIKMVQPKVGKRLLASGPKQQKTNVTGQCNLLGTKYTVPRL